jgi:hypothetical protein
MGNGLIGEQPEVIEEAEIIQTESDEAETQALLEYEDGDDGFAGLEGVEE